MAGKAARSVEDYNIGIIGTPASGKTVYVAVMDWLIGRGRSPKGWKRVYGDAETSLFLEDVIKTMRAGEWPPPTPVAARQALHIRLFIPGFLGHRVIHLRILDLAGELTRLVSTTDRWLELPEAKMLVDWMRSIRGMLILLDKGRIEGEDRAYQRLFLGFEKLLRLKDTGRIPIPVAFVFTKDDKYTVRDPAAEFREHMTELQQVAALRLKRWQTFTCTAVGTTNDGKPPANLEPRGLLEPLEFVLG